MSVIAYGRASSTPSKGVVFIHSCPRAVTSHIEWALAKAIGAEFTKDFTIEWSVQPVEPHTVRAEIIWTGPQGLGAQIASSLLAFKNIRYEVTEDPSPGREGERFAATPSLGLFRASIGHHGDVMVHEDRLRSVLAQADATGENMAEEIKRLLGSPWDAELEAFRVAHADSNIRVLHHVS